MKIFLIDYMHLSPVPWTIITVCAAAWLVATMVMIVSTAKGGSAQAGHPTRASLLANAALSAVTVVLSAQNIFTQTAYQRSQAADQRNARIRTEFIQVLNQVSQAVPDNRPTLNFNQHPSQAAEIQALATEDGPNNDGKARLDNTTLLQRLAKIFISAGVSQQDAFVRHDFLASLSRLKDEADPELKKELNALLAPCLNDERRRLLLEQTITSEKIEDVRFLVESGLAYETINEAPALGPLLKKHFDRTSPVPAAAP